MDSYLVRILPILEDSIIKDKMAHAVNFEKEEIFFDKINYGVLSGGEKTVISWLYLLWKDEMPPEGWRSPFESFGNLDTSMQKKILTAMMDRYSTLKSFSFERKA